MHKNANSFDFDINAVNWLNDTKVVLEKLMNEIESNYKDKFLATLFKNASICKAISDSIA